MKDSFSKRIGIVANAAIIIVAVILGIVLVKKFLLTDSASIHLEEEIAVGGKIDFKQINWSENGKTLLLVLSTDCRFCTENLPFYSRLGRELQNSEIKLAAVFPQDVGVARRYLENSQVAISSIHQSTPPAIGVRGTPTVLLIGKDGEVIDAWFGKLVGDQQDLVLEKLRVFEGKSRL